MQITFKGAPMTLVGNPIKVGDAMPEFTLVDNNLQEVSGKALSGRRVFLTVPSLDTGVCDQEVRRFNQAAAGLPGVKIWAVSLDLPFAQARWCGAHGVQAVGALSDYRDHSFGKATGTRIQELGLLTRAVFAVDDYGLVTYAEYVPEVADHPDYEAVLGHLRGNCRQ